MGATTSNGKGSVGGNGYAQPQPTANGKGGTGSNGLMPMQQVMGASSSGTWRPGFYGQNNEAFAPQNNYSNLQGQQQYANQQPGMWYQNDAGQGYTQPMNNGKGGMAQAYGSPYANQMSLMQMMMGQGNTMMPYGRGSLDQQSGATGGRFTPGTMGATDPTAGAGGRFTPGGVAATDPTASAGGKVSTPTTPTTGGRFTTTTPTTTAATTGGKASTGSVSTLQLAQHGDPTRGIPPRPQPEFSPANAAERAAMAEWDAQYGGR